MGKAIIYCEESQAVCKELRALGHEAFSCDILPCSGGHPEWHIKGDANKMFIYHKDYPYKFNLRIGFPPCTDLSVSGAKHFWYKRDNGSQRKSIEFFLNVWLNSDVVENPIGIMNTPNYLKKWFPDLYNYALRINFPFKPSQIIQPWQFGHGETKATCLWIKNLPLLTPTNIVSGRDHNIWKMPPSKDRAKLRSKTFPGIAKAMAEQWGSLLTPTT